MENGKWKIETDTETHRGIARDTKAEVDTNFVE